jgi:hypothetical protein
MISFLEKVVPWMRLCQEYTKGKAEFLGRYRTEAGILSSVLLADCLIVTREGEHPLSKEEYRGRYANNLFLLEAPEKWSGKVQKLEGKRYRSYKTYHDLVTDYSDLLVFSGLYDDVLTCPLQEQLEKYCEVKLYGRGYYEQMRKVIEVLDLGSINVPPTRFRQPQPNSSYERQIMDTFLQAVGSKIQADAERN